MSFCDVPYPLREVKEIVHLVGKTTWIGGADVDARPRMRGFAKSVNSLRPLSVRPNIAVVRAVHEEAGKTLSGRLGKTKCLKLRSRCTSNHSRGDRGRHTHSRSRYPRGCAQGSTVWRSWTCVQDPVHPEQDVLLQREVL